jgi:hypothetical protein
MANNISDLPTLYKCQATHNDDHIYVHIFYNCNNVAYESILLICIICIKIIIMYYFSYFYHFMYYYIHYVYFC